MAEPVPTETADAQASPSPAPVAALSSYADTAWRSTAENGALFATYLDSGGHYRELRNGDPYQTGIWTYAADGRLCLTPNAENAQGGCWTPRPINEDGTLVLVNDAGRRIELTRITHEPPAEIDEEPEAEETAE